MLIYFNILKRLNKKNAWIKFSEYVNITKQALNYMYDQHIWFIYIDVHLRVYLLTINQPIGSAIVW